MNQKIKTMILLSKYISFYSRVLNTQPNNLITYWQLNEAVGSSSVVNYAGKTGNILQNGNFENYPYSGGDWNFIQGDGTAADDATTMYKGAHALKLTSGASSNTFVYASANTTVNASTRYTISFYTKGDGTNAGRFKVRDFSNNQDIINLKSTGITSTTYTLYTETFTTPVGCRAIVTGKQIGRAHV